MEKGSKVYPKFNQHLNFSGLSWTEPLTQITLPNVMLFQSTFAVNPLQARLLDCLHPACPCLLTCIFGVPTTGVQKLRTRSSWKTLNHVLLPLAFPVLFLLVTLACTLNIFGFLYAQVHGSAGEIWAAVAAPFPTNHPSCCYVSPWAPMVLTYGPSVLYHQNKETNNFHLLHMPVQQHFKTAELCIRPVRPV